MSTPEIVIVTCAVFNMIIALVLVICQKIDESEK